jgi:hypothetical protein
MGKEGALFSREYRPQGFPGARKSRIIGLSSWLTQIATLPHFVAGFGNETFIYPTPD